MPPIPANRTPQSSSVNTNITLNDNNGEKHTTSVVRLVLHIFKCVYLFLLRMLAKLLVVVKRVVKFLVHFLTFIFVALRGSRKKVW